MTPIPRLGGFRVLNGVDKVSVITSENAAPSPAELLRVLSEARINLAYLTYIHQASTWGLNIAVEPEGQNEVAGAVKSYPGLAFSVSPARAILSIFPHKKSLEITSSLLELFNQHQLELDGLANSPSAISVILKEKLVSSASRALFEPFTFRSYRSPADWKLAQKGKEQLYKEVVASYQEKKPKVYGLLCHEGQELESVRLEKKEISAFGKTFRKLSRLGLTLTFIATAPYREPGKEMLAFCLPRSRQLTGDLIPQGFLTQSLSPVSVFSMNGPHFGDRYGIANELLTNLEEKGINLLALSCTIASVTGVVHSRQLTSCIDAIRRCFDVPSVINKE